MTLEQLYQIIAKRKKQMPKGSYVASLFKRGKDYMAQKVGEEAIEVIISTKNNNKSRIVGEIADLWFHLLILMVYYDIKLEDILSEFKKRRKKRIVSSSTSSE